MNLLVQILLGIILEVFHSWWRVMMIYFAGVLAGSLGTFVFDSVHQLAGASGGVYSLITAHVATIILVSGDLIDSYNTYTYIDIGMLLRILILF